MNYEDLVSLPSASIKSNISGIYFIGCSKTKKFYIGSSKNVKKRFYQHKYCLTKNKHSSLYMQNSWNLYGEDSFIFSLLEECLTDKLLEREQFYLDSTKCYIPEIGFNTGRDAKAAGRGIKLSEERKKKCASWTGRRHTEEAKKKIRIGNMGKTLSKETKLLIGESSRKRIISEEAKLKIKEKLINRTVSTETKIKLKKKKRTKKELLIIEQSVKEYLLHNKNILLQDVANMFLLDRHKISAIYKQIYH